MTKCNFKLFANCIGIILLLSLSGCEADNSSPEEAKVSAEIQQSPAPEPKTDSLLLQTSYEKEMSMYNEKYLLKITPAFSPELKPYQASLFLLKKQDTILQQLITIDSIARKNEEMEIHPARQNLASTHSLGAISDPRVRTNSLYLDVVLHSLADSSAMNFLLKFKYSGKERGKWWVNVL